MYRNEYRATRKYENVAWAKYPGVGMFDMPQLDPVRHKIGPEECLGFNYAKGCREREKYYCHFYLDDYQFNRVWNQPNQYLQILRGFKAVIAPDFSLYTDFPKPLQIYNLYRSRWCARYWQDNDITVIPSVRWVFGDPSSYEWCFDGIPQESTIALSTISGWRDRQSREWFVDGYRAMLDRVRPGEILVFGKYWPELQAVGYDGHVVEKKNTNLLRKHALSEKEIKGGIDDGRKQ